MKWRSNAQSNGEDELRSRSGASRGRTWRDRPARLGAAVHGDSEARELELAAAGLADAYLRRLGLSNPEDRAVLSAIVLERIERTPGARLAFDTDRSLGLLVLQETVAVVTERAAGPRVGDRERSLRRQSAAVLALAARPNRLSEVAADPGPNGRRVDVPPMAPLAMQARPFEFFSPLVWFATVMAALLPARPALAWIGRPRSDRGR